jgi:flagellar biosynthesis GTPase FlhF
MAHGPDSTPQHDLEDVRKDLETRQAKEVAQVEEERQCLEAEEARQRDAAVRERDAAARERDAAARERTATASEAAQLERERQRLAEEAKVAEETESKCQEAKAAEEQSAEAPELTSAQKNARAIKELKAAVDKHRRASKHGEYLWRTLSLLFLHLIILSIASAFFVSKSDVLQTSSPPLAPGYRTDIIRGLIIIAIVSLPLLLEYLRNWRKHKFSRSRLDKISVDMTNPNVDLSTIRIRLNKILDDRSQSFVGSRTDE